MLYLASGGALAFGLLLGVGLRSARPAVPTIGLVVLLLIAGTALATAQANGLERQKLNGIRDGLKSELDAAQALGCDFAVLGPVQATASHPGAEGMGWTRFAALREGVSLPIYAIGGLGPDDLVRARQHGGQGIAAIRALWPLA